MGETQKNPKLPILLLVCCPFKNNFKKIPFFCLVLLQNIPKFESIN